MIDWEQDGASNPDFRYAELLYDALHAEALNARSLYCSAGEWQANGSPSLNARPWSLVKASYGPDNAGFGSVVYPGDTSARWAPMGVVAPTILQFGSRILISGYNGFVDGDAYRGTLAELSKTGLFKNWSDPMPQPGPITGSWVQVNSPNGEAGWQTDLVPVDTQTHGTAATRLVDIERNVDDILAAVEAIKAKLGA
jgi:hypothetical protein